MRLITEHDRALRIGRAVELAELPDGLWGVFALHPDAGLGGRTGLSVGIGLDADMAGDPACPSVWLVRRAAVLEVSLTHRPTFDLARVTTVVASHPRKERPWLPLPACT